MHNYTVVNEDSTSKRATMTLTGYISSYDSNNTFRAATFLDKFNELIAKYDRIDINILNLYGGSITEGIPIYNAIVNAVKEGKVKISGKIEGLAASMGSIIAMAIPKEELEMGNMARLMNHRARGGGYGTAEDVRQAADMILSYEDDMVTILAGRTGMTSEEVRAKWMDGKDHYIQGTEAKKLGLVGKVGDSKVNGTLPNNIKDPEEVYNFFDANLKLNQNPEIDMNLKEQLEKLLDLSEGADIVAAVTALKADAAFKPKFEALNLTVNEAKKNEASALVQKLVDGKHIAEAQKPVFEALFAADHDNAKTAVAGMLATRPEPAPQNSAAEFISEVIKGKGAVTNDTTDKKDYHWYEMNAPQELLVMKDKEPEKFIQLFNAYFDKK